MPITVFTSYFYAGNSRESGFGRYASRLPEAQIGLTDI